MTCLLLALTLGAADARPFGIRVVDEATGRGVPLVQLRTVNHLEFYTDSNGLAAIDEPSFYGREIYFHVQSHGYEFPKDGFGYRGKRLLVERGKLETIRLRRINVAERLYRVTGEGIFRDSLLLGQETPLRHPALNAAVYGSDSVQSTVHQGRIYWFWGDTNRPDYPLGNFHTPGATSALPGQGGLDPSKGVELQYFVDPDKAFAKETAKMPGDGPTWIDGLASVKDADGRMVLTADYAKIRPPFTVHRRGLLKFDHEQERFEEVLQFPLDAVVRPGGHTFTHTEGEVEYVYFAQPYPLLRAPARLEPLQDLSQYETFSCLAEGTTLEEPKIDRDSRGEVQYAWKRNVPMVGPKEQKQLVDKGLLKESEQLLALRDVETGEPILAHSGSVNWNAHRNRWIMIALQLYGSSVLGEVWYAEAETPVGPWVYARKVVTHDKYSFYNPKHHPFFDQQQGRVIYFEGTYASTFSGNPVPTPRYDYNQVMYRLDLNDKRLTLPVAVYRTGNETGASLTTFTSSVPLGEAAFFALDRPLDGAVGWTWTDGDSGPRLRPTENPNEPAAFYVMKSKGGDDASNMHVALYEYREKVTGRRHYAVEPDLPKERFERLATLGYVWRNPIAVRLPHMQ